MTPTGNVIDWVNGHGSLAADYYGFLNSVLPVETWDDVGTLDKPIPPKAEYPIDWNLVSRWAASCPSLAGVMESVQSFDLMAPQLGWNYAWTRFPQHLHLLDVVEEIYDAQGRKPTVVLEPGCFTGGLLHYLAEHWQVPCVGFDVSPVALDVCSYYCDQRQQKNKPWWLEADFSQVQPANLPENLGQQIEGSLVILNNVIESLGRSFARFPYFELWMPRSLLISYWVNQGATVLLSERNHTPALLRDTVLQRGNWEKSRCTAHVMADFTIPITHEMAIENPLGEWRIENGCVVCFSPPREKNKKRKSR